MVENKSQILNSYFAWHRLQHPQFWIILLNYSIICGLWWLKLRKQNYSITSCIVNCVKFYNYNIKKNQYFFENKNAYGVFLSISTIFRLRKYY